MNRQVLFRGKRSDTGEWIVGSFIHDKYDMMDRIVIDCEYSTGTAFFCQAPSVMLGTVGEFTGEYDINRNRIFEDDIVEFVDKYTGCSGIAKIELWCGKWIYSGQYTKGDHRAIVALGLHTYDTTFRVIGNIHDNPDWKEKDWEEAKND